MRAIEPVLLLGEASSGEAIESTLVATDMGWLQKWAWLMLGLGQDPNRVSLVSDNEPDALAVGSYLSSRLVNDPSAAGLGSNHTAAEDTDGSAPLPSPSDIALLDQFFQQSSDGGMDEEPTIGPVAEA